MKKYLSLVLGAGLFVFVACNSTEEKAKETETQEIATEMVNELEATTEVAVIDSTAAPVEAAQEAPAADAHAAH